MIWNQLPDLENIKNHLVNLHQQNQLPHAILFKGEDGSGALPLALGFVQYLYCDNPKNNLPCGECKSCKQTKNLFYPGFQLLIPKFSTSQKNENEDETNVTKVFLQSFSENIFISFDDLLNKLKGKNKQASISTQDIHTVIESVSYSAVGNKYNIIVIWKPELMLPAAANKLLKTLEEPPPQTLFLLVSSNPEELLPTIISRVQQINIPNYSEIDCIDYLINKFNTEPTTAQEISKICNGNLNKAIHILTNFDEYVELLNDFKEFARLSIKYDLNNIDKFISKFEDRGREYLKRFLEYSLDIFHYALLQNYNASHLIKSTQQEKEFISKFYLYAHESNIPKLYEIFNDAYHHAVRNANIRILLNDLFLRCNELLKKKPTTNVQN